MTFEGKVSHGGLQRDRLTPLLPTEHNCNAPQRSKNPSVSIAGLDGTHRVSPSQGWPFEFMRFESIRK